jgi:hypothetical protein
VLCLLTYITLYFTYQAYNLYLNLQRCLTLDNAYVAISSSKSLLPTLPKIHAIVSLYLLLSRIRLSIGSDCKHISGSAFASNVIVKNEDLTVSSLSPVEMGTDDRLLELL